MKNVDEMVEAIQSEVELRQPYLTEPIETIYFGGGTPSLLAASQIEQIIGQLGRYLKTSEVKEITIEANPEDISREKAEKWLAIGINRISLGIQTLDDKILKNLNRAHDGQQAIEAIRILQLVGLRNMTIDLMYGLPGQTVAGWEHDLQEIIARNIPHVSSYALTIEPKTVFGHRQQEGHLTEVTDEYYEAQYLKMCDVLGEAGYEHYEVSNFAQPGFRSLHNQLYWQGAQYLGLGPGAHSFDGQERQFNPGNNAAYVRAITNGSLPAAKETLDSEQQYNEYLLTRLRTSAGIDLEHIKSVYKIDLRRARDNYFRRCITEQLAYLENDNFILTEKGFFLSDAIILELMNEYHENQF